MRVKGHNICNLLLNSQKKGCVQTIIKSVFVCVCRKSERHRERLNKCGKVLTKKNG